MAREQREDRNPFERGYVSDVPPEKLGGGFAADLQDAIFTGGVTAKRGAPTNVGATFTSSNLVAVRSALDNADPTIRRTLCIADNGSGGFPAEYEPDFFSYDLGGFTGTGVRYRLIRGPVRGEWICCDANGIGPLKRITCIDPGTGTPSAATGTVTVTGGSTSVAGTGTNFTSSVRVGMYLAVWNTSTWVSYGMEGANFYRVMSVDSDTKLTIEHGMIFSGSGLSWEASFFGVFGIHSNVSDTGRIDFQPGSPDLANGEGTYFLNGSERDQVSDSWGKISLVGQTAENGGWTGPTLMVTDAGADGITTDISSEINGNITDTNHTSYRILRPLTGKAFEFHNNRPWAANLAHAPNRLQWGRAGWPFEIHNNGIDSTATEFIDMKTVESIEVPAPYAEGEIVGLVSAPGGGLIIARTSNVYILWGDPPNHTVQLLDAGVGALDPRAVFASEHGVFIAGPTGVWYWPGGGGFKDITAGKINQEYRDWVDASGNGYDPATDYVVVYEEGEHLVVSGRINSVDNTWAFWLGDKNLPCTGKYTGIHARDAHSTRFPGKAPETIFCYGAAQRPASMRGVFEDDETANSGDFAIGDFKARTGGLIAVDYTDSTRLRRVRVAAQVINEAAESTSLQIATGSRTHAVTVHRSIAGDTSDNIKIKVVRPDPTAGANPGGALGKRVRDAYVELSETGNDPKAIRIFSVVADSRSKEKRV